MKSIANSFIGRNISIRLFELGKEIPLKRSKVVKEEKVVVNEETEFEIGEAK